ncbi:MAG: hypothetical protein Q9220_006340 [cf. Caloplaca sp. 1 TL-2023]
MADAEGVLRVLIDSTIGWSSKTDHLPDDSAVECFAADASCSILIEMVLDNKKVDEHFSSNFDIVYLLYHSGLVYSLAANDGIHHAINGNDTLENALPRVPNHRRTEQDHGINLFLSLKNATLSNTLPWRPASTSRSRYLTASEISSPKITAQ